MSKEKFFGSEQNLDTKPADSEDDLKSKRTKLIAAIIISMIFIIAAWILTLPFQLRKVNEVNAEIAGWQEIKEEMKEEENDFKAALESLRSSYDELERQTLSAEKKQNVQQESNNSFFGEEISESLRNKLKELPVRADAADGAGTSTTKNID
jgi:Tfp pilus assembly protein PilO